MFAIKMLAAAGACACVLTACGGSSSDNAPASPRGSAAPTTPTTAKHFECSANSRLEAEPKGAHDTRLPSSVAGFRRVSSAQARTAVHKLAAVVPSSGPFHSGEGGLYIKGAKQSVLLLLGAVALNKFDGDAYGKARVNFACSAFQGAGFQLARAHEVPTQRYPDPTICDSGVAAGAGGHPTFTTMCAWMDDTFGVVSVLGLDRKKAERVGVATRAAVEH